MPLERFIPKSPDPFIRNSQDFEVAKFGHLNTIIEYVNTYVVTDSLQLSGTGPLTSTARYITDSLGNASSLAISSGNIGIGTSTPTTALDVIGAGRFYQSFGIGVPSLFVYNGRAEADSTLRLDNPGGGKLYFGGVGLLNETNAAFGQLSAPSARVHIKGSGSTSATTSLLVQNSAATQILKVQDNGEVFVNQGNQQVIFTGAGGISRIQAPNEMIIGLGASFNAMKVYFDGRIGLQNDAVYISSGNVGIGTTAPTSKLELNGALTISGNNIGVINLVKSSTSSTAFWQGNNTGPAYQTNYFNFQNNTGYNWTQTDSTSILFIDSPVTSGQGKVSVGAGTSPTARLQIKGSGSTSATTSLLVQNSAGNRLLETKDNGDLYIGNTASDTGTIFVPYSPTFVDRVFMRIDGGFPLFSTISNALLEISCSQFYTQGNMAMRNANQGIIGQAAVQTNNSSIQLTTSVNAYNGTNQDDACNLLYIKNNGVTLQANGSVNFLKLDGTVNEAGGGGVKFCTGIYYNPTLTGGALLANSHYCYHATSGQMMVNTTSPNASAQLQVDSTTRGFLPPRMTTTQRTSITSPAAGLIVYDTTTNKSYTYDGTAWQAHW